MSKYDIGVPGNPVEEHRQRVIRLAKEGEGVALYDHIMSEHWRGQIEVLSLSLRAPQSRGGEFLVVLRGLDEEGAPVVAFHSAGSAGEALAGAARRVQSGHIRWKPDAYRSGSGG